MDAYLACVLQIAECHHCSADCAVAICLSVIIQVLGCITDRETAIQIAFKNLEDKYHWLVNLVCQVIVE